MDNTDKIEQYKLLLDIYYHEVNLFYSKATVFVAIQTALLAGFVASIDKLQTNITVFTLGIIFAIVLSGIQILISIRGNAVNNALIKTIAEYEKENDYSLLQKFSKNTVKINRVMGMNSPSYLFVFLNITFLLLWSSVLLIFILFPAMDVSSWLSKETNQHMLIVPVLSIIYAVTMKIADLLDEHGLYWFKGGALLFGFLCAVAGSFMIFLDDIVAQMIFAMIMSFVVRKRIDYANHIVAFVILVVSYMINGQIIIEWFLFFFASVILLGLIKDLKYKSNKSRFAKIIAFVYLYIPIIYAIPALIYSIVTKDWVVAVSFFLYDLTYNITRFIGEKNYKQYYS